MKPGRLALAAGYVLSMIAVAALGAWGIVDAAEEVKEGVDWHVLELSMIGASWLLATMVFGAIFALRGFSLAAPITYLVSCIELAWMTSMVAIGIGKHGAPGPYWSGKYAIFVGGGPPGEGLSPLLWIAQTPPFALTLVTLLAWFTYEQSSWSGLRAPPTVGAVAR